VVLARYVADLISKHGLYETAIIDVSRYPYLEREEKKAYDMFTVADIMSTPVVTLGPRERVQRVVKLLRQVEHNGFPVVDPMTHEFLGLVRRDQLVALLEFGVFEKDETNGDSRAPPTSHSSGRSGSTPWTPQPGVGKSPLMNLAYHINDDRYDDVNSAATPSSSARQGRRLGEEQQDDDDLYDTNAWIDTLRQALAHWDEDPIDSVVDVLNDDLPVKSLSHGSFSHLLTAAAPAGALRKPLVETNRRGNLFIAWMDPAFQKHWVRLSAVMNRGTYCVPHYCPLSKAHRIFTTLGLRHLIVLGEGGQVVGVLTRINFLKESIQERTGVCF
jgi:CBS domain-containing protein